jgi:hypothetical protein
MAKIVGQFVWIMGLRGKTYSEKWPIDMPHGGKVGKKVVRIYDLEAHAFSLKISILEQRYPAPPDDTAPPKSRIEAPVP